jgi:hypothetical protein
MIQVSEPLVFQIYEVESSTFLQKPFSCPFKFAKKMKHQYEIYRSNKKIVETCHSIFPENYYVPDISDYLSTFLTTEQKYTIKNVQDKDDHEKIIILPYYEMTEKGGYAVFATCNTSGCSLVIKYRDKFISLVKDRCLYLSHVIRYNNTEFGVLSMSNLFDIQNVQHAYNLVRKYMEICNNLSTKENRKICKDWLYQEISTYIFKIQLLSAESVFASLNKYKVEEEVFYTCKTKEFEKVAKSFFVEIK